jgi:hypothetical protein
MWDFNWGMFWALVAYGTLKFGVKRVLGLYGARVSQTSYKRIHREHSLLPRKMGWGDRGTPRRPAPSKPAPRGGTQAEEGVDIAGHAHGFSCSRSRANLKPHSQTIAER